MKNFTLKRIKSLIDKSVLEEPTLPFLDERYNEVTNMIGHSNPYYKLFYHIAKELNPKTVVELGGWRGYAAAHFAGGNSNTKVITIDHHSDPGDDVNQQKMIECCQEFPNMHYVQGWTTGEYVNEYHKGVDGYPKVLEFLDGDSIDVLFIDSWHEQRYFMRDWNVYKKLLSPLALVIADDLMNTELFINMEETWQEFPGEKMIDNRPHHGIPMGFSKIDTRKKKDAKTNQKSSKRKTAKVSK